MKKHLIFKLLSLVLILSILTLSTLSGCKNSDSADVYFNMAQDFINKGDYDSAVDILEKGMSETGDVKLAELLKEALRLQLGETSDTKSETQPTVETEEETEAAFDAKIYEGMWSTEDIGWEDGGIILEIDVSNNVMSFNCSDIQYAPYSKIAEFNEFFAASDIKDNIAKIEYEDSWGNSGVFKIKFCNDRLECTVSDVKYFDDDMIDMAWSFSEGSYTLVKNDSAYESLQYTDEEYNEFLEELYGY